MSGALANSSIGGIKNKAELKVEATVTYPEPKKEKEKEKKLDKPKGL